MQDTADACRQQGLVFLPIALETLGGMHHLAVNQLKRLGAALARHTGSDEREVVSQLMQKISLHLMRGNAAMITSRRPDVGFLPPGMDGVEWFHSICKHLTCNKFSFSQSCIGLNNTSHQTSERRERHLIRRKSCRNFDKLIYQHWQTHSDFSLVWFGNFVQRAPT